MVRQASTATSGHTPVHQTSRLPSPGPSFSQELPPTPASAKPPAKVPQHLTPTAATLSFLPTTTTTVTTVTTTTTTSFPPLVFKPPPSQRIKNGLEDIKNFPLADTPTPPSLKRFCFDYNGTPTWFREDDDIEDAMGRLQETMTNLASGKTQKITTVQTKSDPRTGVLTPVENENTNPHTHPRSSPRKRPLSPMQAPATAPIQTQSKSSPTVGTRLIASPPPSKRARGYASRPAEASSSAATLQTVIQADDEERQEMVGNRDTARHDVSSPVVIINDNVSTPVEDVFPTSSSIHPSDQSFHSPRINHVVSPILNSPSPSASTHLLHHNGASSRGIVETPPFSPTTETPESGVLPSPSLSPVTGAVVIGGMDVCHPEFGGYFEHGIPIEEDGDDTIEAERQLALLGLGSSSSDPQQPTLLSLPAILSTFDALPQTLQSYLLFHLLKRSPTQTLQHISSVILPALKRDFMADLPVELGIHILGFLDVKSMCRSARVSKRWRGVVDGDAGVWRKRIENDGFEVPELEDIPVERNWERASGTGKSRLLSDSLVVEKKLKSDPANEKEEQWETYEIFKKEEEEEEASGSSVPVVHTDGEDDIMEDADDAMSDDSDYITVKRQRSVRQSKGPLQPSTNHPYKSIYRRHHIIRQNWLHGRHQRIEFPGHSTNVVTCLQFDNEKIISGSDDHCINVYDTATGLQRKVLEGHQGGVWALQYVGNTLVSGSTDRTVRVWDIERGECTHIFQGHTSTVRCLQIVLPTNMNPDPNGLPRLEPPEALIVTGSRDSSLKVWKLPDPIKDEPYLPELSSPSPNDDQGPPNSWLRHTLSGHSHSVRALAAQGNLLVSGSYDNSIRVWNIWTGELLYFMEGHTQKVYSVVLDYHRRRCMSGSMDGTVRVWSLDDGSCISVLEGHSMLVGLLGLTPRNLVSAAADSTLRIWNAQTGVCEHVLSGHHGAITCFQHDERKVISGSEGGLKMWDIKTGKLVRDLLSNVNGVWRVAFDERRCVCAVHRNGHTWFEVLDYGVEGLEEDYNATEDLKPSGSSTRVLMSSGRVGGATGL